jgi:hypothetical protein
MAEGCTCTEESPPMVRSMPSARFEIAILCDLNHIELESFIMKSLRITYVPLTRQR